jgi:hypothetical protein
LRRSASGKSPADKRVHGSRGETEEDQHGLVPNGDGWYVIKVRDVVGFTVDEVAKRNGASFADITR